MSGENWRLSHYHKTLPDLLYDKRENHKELKKLLYEFFEEVSKRYKQEYEEQELEKIENKKNIIAERLLGLPR